MRILSKEIFPKCNESLEISLFLILEYLYSWYIKVYNIPFEIAGLVTLTKDSLTVQ